MIPRLTRPALGVLVVVLVLGGSGAAALVLRSGGSATPTVAGEAPRFVDESASSGLSHVYDGEFEFATGGGVAVFDCNDDGRPDLYIAGGGGPAALFRNDSPTGGALRFTPVHDAATDLERVTGAYPIDIDGDRHTDLAVLRDGEDVFLRGTGDCRFERANERWNLADGDLPTMSFSAKWEGDATLPTMAVGRYVDPAFDDPSHLCDDNALYRPDPAGKDYLPAIPLTPSWCALSMLFSDWDRSGRIDLRVSNDQQYYLPTEGSEQLWRVAPGEAPRLYSDADGWVSLRLFGMGIASYDLTGDGYPEVFLTSQGPNRLQTLTAGPSQPAFRDIGLKHGVNAGYPYTGKDTDLPSTAWHDEFADVNNDGFADLFIAKGNVDAQPGYAREDPSNLLLGQPDGTFREVADQARIVSFARGRGAALVDFNGDGLLDLVQVNYRDPVLVWRNIGSGTAADPAPMGNWVELRISQSGANVDAIGAWVEVKIGDSTVRRELTIGGGHAGGQLGWIHVGLGPADGAEVRVLWPGGEAGPWLHVPANERAIIERGATSPTRWQPGG